MRDVQSRAKPGTEPILDPKLIALHGKRKARLCRLRHIPSKSAEVPRCPFGRKRHLDGDGGDVYSVGARLVLTRDLSAPAKCATRECDAAGLLTRPSQAGVGQRSAAELRASELARDAVAAPSAFVPR